MFHKNSKVKPTLIRRVLGQMTLKEVEYIGANDTLKAH
jgi:hypothetical protein